MLLKALIIGRLPKPKFSFVNLINSLQRLMPSDGLGDEFLGINALGAKGKVLYAMPICGFYLYNNHPTY